MTRRLKPWGSFCIPSHSQWIPMIRYMPPVWSRFSINPSCHKCLVWQCGWDGQVMMSHTVSYSNGTTLADRETDGRTEVEPVTAVPPPGLRWQAVCLSDYTKEFMALLTGEGASELSWPSAMSLSFFPQYCPIKEPSSLNCPSPPSP